MIKKSKLPLDALEFTGISRSYEFHTTEAHSNFDFAEVKYIIKRRSREQKVTVRSRPNNLNSSHHPRLCRPDNA
jgi:hypothetical protein